VFEGDGEEGTATLPRCHKQGYASAYRAARALLKIVRRPSRCRREKRFYYCDECGSWHLTSQEKLRL
jgi:hypothetical protein